MSNACPLPLLAKATVMAVACARKPEAAVSGVAVALPVSF